MSTAPPYPKIECRFRRNEDHALSLGELKQPEFGLVDRWLATEKIDGTNIRVCLEDTHEHSQNGGEDCSPARSECYKKTWGVNFYGRTDKAQMPDFIQEHLESTFKLDDMKRLWQCRRSCALCGGVGRLPVVELTASVDQVHTIDVAPCPNLEPYPITLYGEAYGARIQKGGYYRRDGDISFRLFDVLVAERSWLGWDNVVEVANVLNISTVPVLHAIPPYAPYNCMDADAIIDLARKGFTSEVAQDEGTPRLAEGVVARTNPYLFDGHGRRVVWKIKTKDFRGEGSN